MEAFVFLIIWFVFACAIGGWASSRGRSALGFGALSFFLSPVLAGIVLLVVRDLNKAAEHETEQRREHERQLESIRAIASSRESGQTPAPAQPTSVADELSKLAKLRDSGVLTEAEFQAQKAAVLRPGS